MKFLLNFYGEEGRLEDADPAETQAGIERWSAFDREAAEAGALIACEPLQGSATAKRVEVGDGDERIVVDGPFAETKEQLGGFSLLECEDLDEALAWAHKVPVQPGWTVEVRQVMVYDRPADPAAAEAEAPAS